MTNRRPPPELPGQLEAWVCGHYGVDAHLDGLVVLPGHAGLTYGFDVRAVDGSVLDRLVLRLPPKGVKLQGNTDVLRQAPLLEALAAHGARVAPIRVASEDEQWFGVPYLVVARMPGRNVSIDDGGESPTAQHFLSATSALAALHRVPWTRSLASWATPRTYGDEARAWDRALDKARAYVWHGHALETRNLLIEREPTGARIGITHGDYQFSNLLFVGDELVAILDWEISGIGPQLLDLGWFLVINDQRSWAHDVNVGDRPSDAELRAAYESSSEQIATEEEIAYACALAAYRFAIIAGLNLSLHRSGRRVDEHWELIGPSIPLLLARATDDLAASS